MADWIKLFRVYGWFLCVGFIIRKTYCYNLEDRLPLFKFGEVDSNFGYSVAQHRLTKDDTSGLEDTLLMVGAPTAQGITPNTKTGGVYSCPVTTDPTDCRRVSLELMDDPPAFPNPTVPNTGQWLGVSLKSQGPGKFLVTCAHRYRWHWGSSLNEEEYVCGKCLLMKGTSAGRIEQVSKFNATLSKDFISSPCEFLLSKGKEISLKNRFGYTQAGTSLFISDSEYLLGEKLQVQDQIIGYALHVQNLCICGGVALRSGGPGAWRWSGSLFDIEMPDFVRQGDEPLPPPLGLTDRTPEFYQSMTCPIEEWRGKSNRNKPKCNEFPLNRDSYMGFSVAMSDSILPNTKEMFYIAGAPRGNNTGAVVFLRRESGHEDDFAALRPDESNIVMGESISSSFGYSIATTDINGDHLDDLIVGAPQYYERKRGGAVYVYINVPGIGFGQITPQILYGPSDSLFGRTVAALGDIDQDGYNDFAVGAPYQSKYGAVHIYRGSDDGIVKKSQTIFGRDYTYIKKSSNRYLKGFGASLSGIVDADSNKYPDLLIGSFSDHVTLIRSRPIITVQMTFEVDRDEIDLDKTECESGGDKWSCFHITYCFVYKARHKEYTGDVELSYTVVADSAMAISGNTPRVQISGFNGSNVINSSVVLPSAGAKICPGKSLSALFLRNMKDRLSEIKVDLEYDLVIPKVAREKRGDPVYNLIKDPILDADFQKTDSKVVRIKNDCGSDGCQSNLTFTAAMPHEIVQGKVTIVPVNVTVTNNKEEAHEAGFTLSVPSDITYASAYTDSQRNITCSQVDADLVKCEIGNPFKHDEKMDLVVNFDITELDWRKKNVEIVLQGSTTSDNPDISHIVLGADIILELDIVLTGSGSPQQVRYSQREIMGENMNETGNIGPSVIYNLVAFNRGTHSAPELKISIGLPFEIYNGKWLLYLVAAEVTSSDGQPAGSCLDADANINVLELQASFVRRSRSKRAATIRTMITTGSENAVQTVLSCGYGAKCVNISCTLEELPADERISVDLYLRLWEDTFLEEEILRNLDLVHIDTKSSLSTNFANVRLNTDPAEIRTTVDHPFFKDDILAAFPWWYILIAAIILLLIYLLIILILVRCGFFKRKRYARRNRESEGTPQRVVN